MEAEDRTEETRYPVERVERHEELHEAVVFCCGSHRVAIADCDGLCPEAGVCLSGEEFERLLAAERRLACVQKALLFLEYGDCSRRRMLEKLKRSFPAPLCEETVSLLEERGYLDDRRLAERYAENYAVLRSYGPLRIRQELYGKGFSADVIEEVLAPYQAADHREGITELLLKKYTPEQLSEPSVRRKANAWLSRQGYSWADISDVLRTLS